MKTENDKITKHALSYFILSLNSANAKHDLSFLLSKIDLEAKNNMGLTTLDLAVQVGNISAVDQLLKCDGIHLEVRHQIFFCRHVTNLRIQICICKLRTAVNGKHHIYLINEVDVSPSDSPQSRESSHMQRPVRSEVQRKNS